MEKNKSVFETLSAINVNDKTEKKKDLTYLSWAWAWSEVKKAYPDATYKIGETQEDEVLGFMCHTEVTIQGETLPMWLPVMDGANKAMLRTSYSYATKYGEKVVEPASMWDINKAIMRCLVKNLAMFGLGIYIYAGEDLPDAESNPVSPKTPPAPEKKADVLPMLTQKHEKWGMVCDYVKANADKGDEYIFQQLGRKYIITPAIKKVLLTIKEGK